MLSTRYLRLFSTAAAAIEDLQVSRIEPLPQNDDITVLLITEAVLADFPYRSPINREYLNDLVTATLAKGARIVALDVIFDQPTEDEADLRLQTTLRQHRDSIIVATGDDVVSNLTTRQLEWQESYLDGIMTGYADMQTVEGVVREYYPGRSEDPVAKPSFVAAITRALGLNAPTIPMRLHFRRSSLDGDPIRNYIADPDYLENYLDDWFDDKIVLIGADLPGSDQWETPLSEDENSPDAMPGVLIHAQALAQILEGRTYPTISQITAVAILLSAAIAGYLLPITGLPVLFQVLSGVVLLTLYWLLAFMLPASGGLVVPVVAPTIGYFAGALLSAAHGFRRANQQKRFLSGAFRHYVSPTIIDEIIRNPEKLSLGGEKRDLSFVFCDVAEFTSLSEQLAPETVVTELQKYFDGMIKISKQHGGTIDRLVGDGMAVIFGAPLDQDDHAQRAVECAIDIDDFAEQFRSTQIGRGIAWGVTRIGVHTGTAVVGNVGSTEQFHYTAHGDCVNTAARLEGANRILGTRLCISEFAVRGYRPDFFRSIGALVLKGKAEAIECVTSRGGLNQEQLQQYQQAYTLLVKEDKKAIELLEQLSEQLPEDPLIALHLRRARAGVVNARIVLEEK